MDSPKKAAPVDELRLAEALMEQLNDPTEPVFGREGMPKSSAAMRGRSERGMELSVRVGNQFFVVEVRKARSKPRRGGR